LECTETTCLPVVKIGEDKRTSSMNITMRFQRQLLTTCFTKDVSTVDKKNEIESVLKFKPNKRIPQYHIQKATGKVVILKDIHNLASSSKGADEANL
jgi:hypothetical protein